MSTPITTHRSSFDHPTTSPRPDVVRLLDERRLTDRLTELELWAPALERSSTVRVLTPSHGVVPDGPPPVVWLLHGGDSDVRAWTDEGDAEVVTAGLGAVIVMPDAGLHGWYADWRRDRPGSRQRWSTWILDELRPWVEEHWATRTDRSGRAIMGLSMGGFGAMRAAARRPDLFGFVASFSGALDVCDPAVAALVEFVPTLMGHDVGDVFGLRSEEPQSWTCQNPVDLAGQLRGTEIQIRTGDGRPGGVHDATVGPPDGRRDRIEEAVHRASTTFHRRLVDLGIDHVFDDRGPGTHHWPYWTDDLAATLPAVAAHFARDVEVAS